ncbi:MAG: hypothetical protein K2P79_02395 [Sphingomonas sp.]|nr:hypothetical protein [Sphingomonas sp.]
MNDWLIWSIAAALYAAFRLWYDNWRGPLTPAEIETYFTKLADRRDMSPEIEANLRRFLEADDGRDFVMFNIVKAVPSPVADPITGDQVPGIAILQRYSKHFVRLLIKNGGHPAIIRRKIGPYVDSWATEPDPGWTIIGLMRYRSRRDMMNVAVDPQFVKHHPDKLAGTLATFSFPTSPMLQLYIGPRIWLALVLALGAALTQLAVG